MTLQRYLRRHRGEDVAAPLQEQVETSSEDQQESRLQLQRLTLDHALNAMDYTGSSIVEDPDALRKFVRGIVRDVVKNEKQDVRNNALLRHLEDAVVADLSGYGPLQPLMDDPTISDILVNGPKEIWIDRNGILEITGSSFLDQEHVFRILDRMVSSHGRHLEEANPYADIRLEDGSRLHAIIPPLTTRGPVLSIRKRRATPLGAKDLIASGSLSQSWYDFLVESVGAHKNILVSGGAGTGKTTLLNILGALIPTTERVVTIEETLELDIDHPHVLSLEARTASTEGRGEVNLRVLLRNALRMRADRIIVGEVRGAEVFDMLQAMNIGHPGSMTTLHANSPRDAIRRLETLLLLSGVDLPETSLRNLISLSFDVIVQLKRDPQGRRTVSEIHEVKNDGEDLELIPIHAIPASDSPAEAT